MLLLLGGDPVAQHRSFGTASRRPVAAADWFPSQGGTVAEFAFRVIDPVTGAHRGSLANVVTASWEDQWCDAGAGSVTQLWDEPTAALIRPGDIIRCFYQGRAVLSWIADEWDLTLIPEDGAPEGTEGARTWSGPGRITQTNKARIRPARGFDRQPVEDTRSFGWTAPDYGGDFFWPNATEIVQQGAPTVGSWEIFNRVPADWPDPNAWWIWAPSGSATWAPTGWCHFIYKMEVPEGVTRVRVYAAADNVGDVWFDGVRMLTDIGFAQTYEFDLDVTPGTHTISARVYNAVDDLEPGGNPGGFLCSVHQVYLDGTLGEFICHTDDLWKVAPYPTVPPGTTIGAIMLKVLGEAKAAGMLPGLVWSFDAWTDSAGRPWPTIVDASSPVGRDLWTYQAQIAAVHVDIELTPGANILNAWVKDTRGVTRAITLTEPTDTDDPLSGNLRSLTSTGYSTVATAALVRWAGGWSEVDTTGEGEERIETEIDLGAVETWEEADRITRAELAGLNADRESLAATVNVRTGERPWWDYRCGDLVEVPDASGGTTHQRVVALAARIEGDELTITPTLKSRVLEDDERRSAWLKMMIDGALNGASTVVSPPTSRPPGKPTSLHIGEVWHLGAGLDVVDRFGGWSPPGPSNLHKAWFRVLFGAVAPSTITLTIYRDSTVVGSGTIPAGSNQGQAFIGEVVQPDEQLSVSCPNTQGLDITVTLLMSKG